MIMQSKGEKQRIQRMLTSTGNLVVLGKERKEMPRVAPSLANAVKDRDAEDKKM